VNSIFVTEKKLTLRMMIVCHLIGDPIVEKSRSIENIPLEIALLFYFHTPDCNYCSGNKPFSWLIVEVEKFQLPGLQKNKYLRKKLLE
jgi:hypothetical protein